MLIAGLQKLSLVDFPGKVACTVFTGGCNLRCPYCHNSELLDRPPAAMDTEAFFRFLSRRTGLLDGVCVTGGEPCMHRDLPEFLERIRGYGYAVKLDTNGCFPALLSRILTAGLVDYVAVDMKNGPDQYAQTAGVRSFDLDALLESIRLLLESGTDFELRTTVVEPLHSAQSIAGIRDTLLPLIQETGKKIPAYYLQGFVDRDTVAFSGMAPPARSVLEDYGRLLAPLTERLEIRGQ